MVAPDVGRAKPAARFASFLGLPSASAQKERISDTEVIVDSGIKRLVHGFRRALIYDDEIATGSTVLMISKYLIDCGIKELLLVCTHGVFSGNSLAKLNSLPQVKEIVTTDTVPIPPEKICANMTILSVAPVFGEAIWRNANRQTIGDLFTFSDDPDDPVDNDE